MSDASIYDKDMYSTVVSNSNYKFIKKMVSKAYSKSSTSTEVNRPGIWIDVGSSIDSLPGIMSSTSSSAEYLPGIFSSSGSSSSYKPGIFLS